MTRNESAKLTNLLISTWPSGVRGHVWEEVLIPMRYEPAFATYLVAREREHTLSVAHFADAYRQRVSAARRADPEPQLPFREERPLPPGDPRAIAAFNHGLAEGQAETARRRERMAQERGT